MKYKRVITKNRNYKIRFKVKYKKYFEKFKIKFKVSNEFFSFYKLMNETQKCYNEKQIDDTQANREKNNIKKCWDTYKICKMKKTSKISNKIESVNKNCISAETNNLDNGRKIKDENSEQNVNTKEKNDQKCNEKRSNNVIKKRMKKILTMNNSDNRTYNKKRLSSIHIKVNKNNENEIEQKKVELAERKNVNDDKSTDVGYMQEEINTTCYSTKKRIENDACQEITKYKADTNDNKIYEYIEPCEKMFEEIQNEENKIDKRNNVYDTVTNENCKLEIECNNKQEANDVKTECSTKTYDSKTSTKDWFEFVKKCKNNNKNEEYNKLNENMNVATTKDSDDIKIETEKNKYVANTNQYVQRSNHTHSKGQNNVEIANNTCNKIQSKNIIDERLQNIHNINQLPCICSIFDVERVNVGKNEVLHDDCNEINNSIIQRHYELDLKSCDIELNEILNIENVKSCQKILCPDNFDELKPSDNIKNSIVRTLKEYYQQITNEKQIESVIYKKIYKKLRQNKQKNVYRVSTNVDLRTNNKYIQNANCINMKEDTMKEINKTIDIKNHSFCTKTEKFRKTYDRKINTSNESNKIAKFEIADYEYMKEYMNLKVYDFASLPAKNIKKIGEATFSDVFMIDGAIYKIMPLKSNVNDENETDIQDFYKECFINKLLSSEKGIITLYDAFIVKGDYPNEFMRAFESYKNSENKKPNGSLFGVLVMENGGQDLESFEFRNANEIDYFLKEIIEILYRLEKKYKFEHRDMHWGNVMLNRKNNIKDDVNNVAFYMYKETYNENSKQSNASSKINDIDTQQLDITNSKLDLSVQSNVSSKTNDIDTKQLDITNTKLDLSVQSNVSSKIKDDENRQFHISNIGNIESDNDKPFDVNLIDFTLSRITHKNKIAYTDLNTKMWLFEGDEEEDIQFGVYSKMIRKNYKKKINTKKVIKEQKKYKKDTWMYFNAFSNYYWFEYLLYKIEEKYGKNSVIDHYKNEIKNIKTISTLHKKIHKNNSTML